MSLNHLLRADQRLRRRAAGLIGLAVVAGLGLAPRTAGAQTVIQNDSVVDFGNVAIQSGFVANERAAAWLTATCDGNLTNVRVLWLSITGGAADTLGQAITVYEAGTFPIPGSQLLELMGPSMVDGSFNEFPIVPPIPLTTGEAIVVDFLFLDSPPGTGPSVVTDVDGCQSGKNAIFAIPPSIWLDACLLGVSGDFAIRGVLDCDSGEAIFEDDFESGDTSAWDAVVPPFPQP